MQMLGRQVLTDYLSDMASLHLAVVSNAWHDAFPCSAYHLYSKL